MKLKICLEAALCMESRFFEKIFIYDNIYQVLLCIRDGMPLR